MKIKNLGLAAGLTLGGSLMIAGLIFMSMGDTSQGGAGIMIVLGAIVFIPGAIIALISFFGWVSATIYKNMNTDLKRVVKWGLVVAVVFYLGYCAVITKNSMNLSDIDPAYQYSNFPISAATLGGGVVAPEVWEAQETENLPSVIELKVGDEVILHDIATSRMYEGFLSSPITQGFPWFEVEYGDGSIGVMWGGNLCATDTWVNGLNRKCPFESPADNNGESNTILDSIEYGYDTLPGTWQAVSSVASDNEISIFVIHPQESAENQFVKRTQNYRNGKIYEGSWLLLDVTQKLEEESGISKPTLELVVSASSGHGSYNGQVIKLNKDELVLEPGYVYQRVLNPETLIEQWQAQAAERERIRLANAPRAEIAKLAATKIEGLPNALEFYYEMPFSVKGTQGKIRSGPGEQFKQVGSLRTAGTIYVLAETNVEWGNFLWYRIRYGEGLEGYVAGALICAQEYWINGISHYCQN